MKMKTIKISFLLLYTALLSSVSYAKPNIENLKASYDFLVNTNNYGGGALYTGTAGILNGSNLPLSFYDTAEYWGKHVCTLPNTNCAVTDTYNPSSYTLLPSFGLGGDLQIERVNAHNGTNIYDAATWQIAVVLGQVQNNFTIPSGIPAYELANNQNILLQKGYDGNASFPSENANRGITNEDRFKYNGQTVDNPSNAYFFRMVTRDWLSSDPFLNSPFLNYIQAINLPKDNPKYQVGKISWTDWKPITGENAWGFLVGPLQAAYIHYIKGQRNAFVPFNDLAVQNALSILPTFAKMQSKIGGVYYVPSGTLGKQGSQVANPYEVSVENNFSLYGGIKILQATLQAEFNNETDLSSIDKEKIKAALNQIEIMINGDGNKTTQGLFAFFKNYAWKNGEFIQGGLANDPSQTSDWVPTMNPKAVDVNTWGIAALGPKQIEDWNGFGATYKTWQQIKNWGAYGVGKTLWGVGYSNQDGNGIDPSGNYQQGVLSAEWTAGAINMTEVLINYYKTISSTSLNYLDAQKYISNLTEDRDSMIKNISNLRMDKYNSVTFPGKPTNYSELFPAETYQPYLYASKRFMIPFGWYANPIPSTCSTAWMIMLANNFNPFAYGGVQ